MSVKTINDEAHFQAELATAGIKLGKLLQRVALICWSFKF